MKKIVYLLILGATALLSCKEMDSTYQEFIVPNGIIYPQKADSVKVYAGDKRVKMTWQKGNDPKVIGAWIYWSNYTDSVPVDIPTNSDKILSFIVENLEEGSHTFYIKTYDADGNLSIASEASGRVYGDEYRTSLFNRDATIIFTPETNTLSIAWAGQKTDEVKCILEYVDVHDAIIQMNIALDATTTVIEGFKRGLRVNSLFLPPSSIDTFRIEPSIPKITMPVLDHQVITGIDIPTAFRTNATDHGTYIELVATGNVAAADDPNIMTLGLTEALNLDAYYQVYFHIEYQTDRAITNAQLFYGKPNAAGGVSTAEELVFENTGLNPADESKWATFDFDCYTAIKTHAWGAVNHRFRYDYVNGTSGSSLGTTLYIRKMWFDVYILQEVDL
jgi:hypothetical protein